MLCISETDDLTINPEIRAILLGICPGWRAITMSQTDQVNLGYGSVWDIRFRNMTMSQTWFGISQVGFGTLATTQING